MTVYLVVVVNNTEPEARSQTVGVFDHRDEAEGYMLELEENKVDDCDIALVETWETGEMRM